MQLRILLGLFACVLLMAAPAAAQLGGISADFEPVQGYLIMEVEGEYLIDRDASHGVRVGDVFTVVTPGERIVHPVTKEVIGTLDQAEGYLRVTRIKSGYSYARALGQGKFRAGALIKRYTSLEGVFWDQAGSGEPLMAELQQILPDLNWRSYAQAQAMQPNPPAALADSQALYFILTDERLEVRDPQFAMIRAYPMSMFKTQSAPRSTAAANVAARSAAPVAVAPVASSALEERLMRIEQQYAALMQQMQQGQSGLRFEGSGGRRVGPGGVVYDALFPGFSSLGNLPLVIKYADFAPIEDRLMLVATDGTDIRVFDVTNEMQPSGAIPDEDVNQILSVQWWIPAPGQNYVIATIWDDSVIGGQQRIQGKVYRLEGKALVEIGDSLSHMLGSFDIDGDGAREHLMAQNFNPENFFGRDFFDVTLDGDTLRPLRTSLDLPTDFTVIGSLISDLDGDGVLESAVVRNGFMTIYRGQQRLYRSSKSVGGSLSSATYDTHPGSQVPVTHSVVIEVSPILVDLDGGGDLELMTVGSDRGFLSAPGLVTTGEKFRISVFKKREGMYIKGVLGEVMDNPIQGMTLGAGRVMFVSTEPPDLFDQGGNSHLLSFVLNQEQPAAQ